MKLRTPLAAGLAIALTAGVAQAQTVGIGSTKSSMVAAMTTAISKTVSAKSILKMRRQVMGGTQKYIPVVNAGELEFGVSNMIQYAMAVEGRALSSKPYSNLRLVATLMRFRTGLLVQNSSKIRRVSDLKGTRIPSGFKGAPLFQEFFVAMLANAGLTHKDVQNVPAVGLAQSWNLFKQGKVDTVIAGVGGGPNKDMNAKIPSGVRYLSFDTDTPAAKAAIKGLKGGAYELVNKAKPYVAIREPAVLIGYDFTLFSNKNVPDKVVYDVTKALFEGEKDLHAVSAVWRSFNGKRMAKNQDVPMHPGAVKLYKEKGVWKR